MLSDLTEVGESSSGRLQRKSVSRAGLSPSSLKPGAPGVD